MLIISTIKAFSERKIKVVNGRALDAAGNEINSYNLTPEIEKMVGRKD